ncbi:hypothetical protein GCM10010371_47440 [Streptomyces subrutilus]|uniref:Uncharacterized protein n=1 Tax=Streptomyces subrutilus TaxID=36818 RepID=A0A918R2L9_9ACTN|nr:hypothetical protein GCM10010371_47440 [Streptomyces subrutilus]
MITAYLPSPAPRTPPGVRRVTCTVRGSVDTNGPKRSKPQRAARHTAAAARNTVNPASFREAENDRSVWQCTGNRVFPGRTGASGEPCADAPCRSLAPGFSRPGPDHGPGPTVPARSLDSSTPRST